MSKMMLTFTIIHVVISVVLVLAVLMQHGKQQGLSGAIAGGAETFFGKNKGKTIDAVLKKVTAVLAILFVVSSLALAAFSINEYNKANPAAGEITMDENGNFVDENGNIIPVEDMVQPDATEGEVSTEGEEATTEEAATEEVATEGEDGSAE